MYITHNCLSIELLKTIIVQSKQNQQTFFVWSLGMDKLYKEFKCEPKITLIVFNKHSITKTSNDPNI